MYAMETDRTPLSKAALSNRTFCRCTWNESSATEEMNFIFIIINFLDTLLSLWDLSYPTRDWTWVLGSESVES